MAELGDGGADFDGLPPVDPDFDPDQLLEELAWIEQYKRAKDSVDMARARIMSGGHLTVRATVQEIAEMDRNNLEWLLLAALTNLNYDSIGAEGT